jgi:hypothetical protein
MWAGPLIFPALLAAAAAHATRPIIVTLAVLLFVLFFVGFAAVFVGYGIRQWDLAENRKQVAAGEMPPWKPGDPRWEPGQRPPEATASTGSSSSARAEDGGAAAAMRPETSAVAMQAAMRAGGRWAIQQMAMAALIAIFAWPTLLFNLALAAAPQPSWKQWLGAVLFPALLADAVMLTVQIAIIHRHSR